MSFNIRYGTANDGDNSWNARKEFLLQLIRAQSPHLMGLQEALRFQLDEIRSALPHYGESGCGRDDGRTKGEYTAILYDSSRFVPVSEGTFWFSDAPSLPGSVGWGNRITRICSWVRLRDRLDSQTIDIYNVHLDHESQPSRYRSAQALLDTIRHRSSPNPVLIMGDFNAGEMNPAVRLVAEAGFSDTFRRIHPRDSLVGTFHGFTGSRQGEKIDYIFASEKVFVIDAAILRNDMRGRYPSDHYPVTARIQFINTR
jgi:endonuclease/exonuclease/phosphatase family metal-dependent hydrolase